MIGMVFGTLDDRNIYFPFENKNNITTIRKRKTLLMNGMNLEQ